LINDKLNVNIIPCLDLCFVPDGGTRICVAYFN